VSSLGERDRRHVWHPYTQHGIERDPLRVARASGSALVLEDGREIVDGISSWWTCLHGHARRELVEAMTEQARRLDHVLFAGATHEPAVGLAEELLAAAGAPLARVFYTDDGSTAVEVALKMAWQHARRRLGERRDLFVALEGGYHGDTFGAMAVGDPDPFFLPYASLLFRAARVAPRADALEELLRREEGRVAGLLVEPLVQGAGGMRMHSPDFLSAARRLCDRFGVPLIADEVMTGFGRTGALFACRKAGIAPDILCLAKGLTGGMLPLAATLATGEIFESFLSDDRSRALFHGHSMTANPIGCAVARASLALCRSEGTPERLEAIGARIEQGLLPIRDRAGIREIRRTGGIVAVELEPEPDGGAGYLARRSLRLRRVAIENGVLLRPLGDVLYALPPASTTPDECDRIASALIAQADAAGASD
jgi:adenosylmethionine-8-amino-7-oxononanoate aminotransferase